MKKIITVLILLFIWSGSCLSNPTNIDTLPIRQDLGMAKTKMQGLIKQKASSQIPLIEAPAPSYNGNVNLSLPIKLPAARKDHLPEVIINYNNEGGKTWIGNDWDLSFSSITVDTRWGVPQYLSDEESELYLLDGEQLGPVFHRERKYERAEDRDFHLRQDLEHLKIIRHGSDPKNYWWEVRDPEGRIDYYGGHPDIGISEGHLLTTKSGNIVQWNIYSSIDIYDNLITYKYQKKSHFDGENIYPLMINYNGFKNEEGPYTIEFKLKENHSRKDVQINYRTGKKIVIADLLETILISFSDTPIRSYQLEYEEGEFGLTLLKKLEEYGSDGNLFYDYKLDYYNDIREGSQLINYNTPVDWDVPKDNIPTGSISGNIKEFNSRPTILGGSFSTGEGGGIAITVGPPLNPVSKINSAGPTSSFFNSRSDGRISFVDIDSDGLPDKLWKESDGLYFRSNLLKKEGKTGFGPRTKIKGIKDFSKGSTTGWSIGAELTFPPVMAGYAHEESTTTVSTYFADFNGDELLDIAHNGQVYFNSIDENGIPNFTTNSTDTPSPIIKGEQVESDSLSDQEIADLSKRNPLNDVIRTWRAPFTGRIRIEGGPSLIENTSPEAQSYEKADGVIAYIQTSGLPIWTERIEEDDFEEHNLGVIELDVDQGDVVNFRVSSVDDGLYDEVAWSPSIYYVFEDTNLKDENDLPLYAYNSNDDFIITGNKAALFPKDGLVSLQGRLNSKALTDTLYIVLSDAVDSVLIFPPFSQIDSIIEINNLEVLSNDKISCRLWSKSNLDWARIEWSPQFTYTFFNDGSDVLNQDGEPIISLCPDVEKRFYYTYNSSSGLVVNENGLVSITTNFQYPSMEPIFPTVKIKGLRDTIYRLPYQYNVNTFEYDVNATIEVNDGDTLFYSLNGFLEQPFLVILNNSTTASLNGNLINLPQTFGYINKNNDDGYGPEYRQWGQFCYNPTGDLLPIINLPSTNFDTTGIAGDTSLADPNTNTEDLEGTNISLENKFIVMTSDSKSKAWLGSDDLTYVNGQFMSSTRYGLKNLSQSVEGLGLSAPNLITKTRSDGGYGGLGVGPASGGAGYTKAFTWSEKDIGDFNGDRYPDIISRKKITYTNIRGGLSKRTVNLSNGIHEAESEAYVIGLGSDFATSGAKNAGGSIGKGSNKATVRTKGKGRTGMTKAKNASKSSTRGIGISGNFGEDNDKALHTFLDMNGDGLEDKIWENGDVALSNGYGFESRSNWNFTGIGGGKAVNLGAGLGFSINNGDYEAGLSLAKTDNWATIGFVDVNDDALVDQVVSIDPLMIRINTGQGFLPPVTWLDVEVLDSGVGIGESINGAGTFCLEFFFFRVCFNISAFTSQGASNINATFQDVNGDGFVDYLSTGNDDSNLTARNSTINRTNKLKSIHLPLGGKYTVDYEFIGNSYDMPFSKWVMSSLTLEDGFDEDGPTKSLRTFSYLNGNYDRHERQFYGFESVRENHLNSDGEILRTITSVYHNNSYYTKGLISKSTVYNSSNSPFSEIDYTYKYLDAKSGIELSNSVLDSENAKVYPALTIKSESLYDNNNDVLTKSALYTYDSLGNTIEIIELDENEEKVVYQFEYEIDPTRYFAKKLLSEFIYDNDILIRKTEHVCDEKGNSLTTNRYVEENKYITTNFAYDEFSNIIEIIHPANHLNQSLVEQFTYDPELHQLLSSETDGYNLIRAYEHNYLHQTQESFTDENGNVTSMTYDEFGRLISILKPIDGKNQKPSTMKFKYFHQSENPYVINEFYTNEGTIDLIVFEDGLQRIIQEKKKYEFQDGIGYIISGKIEYDALLRPVVYHQPGKEMGNNPYFINSITEPQGAIIYKYDVLDRIIETSDAYNNTTKIEYVIGELDGRRVQEELKTNPKGINKSQFRNFKGNLLGTKKNVQGGPIWMKYEYDGLTQLKNKTDGNGNISSYSYDLLGRRISIQTPDGGSTNLTFDDAGNLISKSTETIRNTINEDDYVRYTYDKERLTSIDYPKYFQNKVQLHYGTDQDSFNRKGRVWLIEDATGGREFYFDYEGRVVKEIRTIMVNRTLTQTFVTTFQYDDWGRINEMVYPDGELVTFTYNKGGELVQMKGLKEGTAYPILIDAGYDKYEDRISITYGNSVNNQLSYDLKGRLTNQNFITNEGILSERKIEYDALDNMINEYGAYTFNEERFNFESEYTYDDVNRLTDAKGKWENDQEHVYDQIFDYDQINNLLFKAQTVVAKDKNNDLLSRAFDYKYENQDQPTRPSEVGGKSYTYDGNGNTLLISSEAIFDYDQHIFDEENRLAGVSNNGNKSRYTYDAFGHRTIKSYGDEQGVFVNGAPAGFVEHSKNYTVQVSPYFSFTDNRFLKHYFIDNSRIQTRQGTGVFVTTLSNGPEITAGNIDFKKRIQTYEESILQYYADMKAPPGPPTLLAYTVQPEINQIGFPNGVNHFNTTPPSNWPNLPPPDTTGPPGHPIFFENADLTNENVKPGFNLVNGSISKEYIQNYYHYDPLGSVVLTTDNGGNQIGLRHYLASGETWQELSNGDLLVNFAYRGIQIDEESGYYKIGDSYYDPKTNMNFSTDYGLQFYGDNTIKKRIEGSFFYEYAEGISEVGFDTEILNAERPNPLISVSNNPEVDFSPTDDPEHRANRKRLLKQNKKVLKQKKTVNKELNSLIASFKNQESESSSSFYYDDFATFAQYQIEEKKYKKRQKQIKQARKKKQKTKRKVRFK